MQLIKEFRFVESAQSLLLYNITVYKMIWGILIVYKVDVHIVKKVLEDNAQTFFMKIQEVACSEGVSM